MSNSSLISPPDGAQSLTPTASQQHLAALLNTMLKREVLRPVVRVLDMGCGDARLLAYLAQSLLSQNPHRQFDLFGFEVGGIGSQGRLRSWTVTFLNKHAPGQWRRSYRSILGFRAVAISR